MGAHAQGGGAARQRVVIVGGSFAGLAVARNLRKDFDVTIIDRKDYFEYTPGVLRLLVRPEAFPHLTAPLASLR
ncbi:hypothetical protein T484DRAFT_1844879 [Baffinella frigidus]|nr:hypothetical protein T484DRAFT_1844879 [Cryptophyta sp. CCMP2293]